MHMDDNGDAEGNYTLLARHWHESLYTNWTMLPVGHFEIGTNNSLPVSVTCNGIVL